MSTHQLAALARTAEPRLMLRRFLALDAAVTGANALAYLALSARSAAGSAPAPGCSSPSARS